MSAIEAFLDQLLRPAISFLLVVNAAGVVRFLARLNIVLLVLLTSAIGGSPFIWYVTVLFNQQLESDPRF